MICYHDLRNFPHELARETVRKVLEKNKGNIFKTAKILGISRKTVRRVRDGSLILP